LFEACSVDPLYSTIRDLAEDVLQEHIGSVRLMAKKTIMARPGEESMLKVGVAKVKDALKKWNQPNIDRKILLIDEVDVFFGENFYGRCYSPSTNLASDTAKNLMQYVWDNRNTITLQSLKNSVPYHELLSEYPNMEVLFDQSMATELLSDVKDYKIPEFECNGLDICYFLAPLAAYLTQPLMETGLISLTCPAWKTSELQRNPNNSRI